jgi:hypothetical protein
MVEAVPLELQREHLLVRTGAGRTSLLELSRVQAMSAAIVSDLAARPVLVIDLLLNWGSVVDDTLQLVRLRSNTFDPRSLFPDAGSGMNAIVELIRFVRTRSGADVVPCEAALSNGEFERFDTLAAYEREVLNVDRP